MPGSQLASTEKPTSTPAQPQADGDTGARTVWDALRMTLQYGKEYADDISLAGEPGNFRFSKNKEAATGQIKGHTNGSIATPSQSRAQSMAPGSSNSNAAASQGAKVGGKGPLTPDGAVKVKRRKSKASEPSP